MLIFARAGSLRCLALPCVALRCIALLCLSLRCVALPWLALSCLAFPWLALPCLALPWLGLAWLALRCLALPCLALPSLRCVALPCHALPCLASGNTPLFRRWKVNTSPCTAFCSSETISTRGSKSAIRQLYRRSIHCGNLSGGKLKYLLYPLTVRCF